MSGDRSKLVTAVVLVAVVGLLYLRVGGHAFVDYDDPQHLVDNPVVNQGLTLASLRDAFLTAPASNWQPLTWISHMLVWQFAGDHPGPHLLVNVALHALNAVLLLLALSALTRRWGLSLCVAFLFAVHPLRVESVAWATERKDVLSGTFFMLTLWAYARYARRPGWRAGALVTAAFTLGLLAKPMLVTMPVLLLLLDVWPLRREIPWSRRVQEKIPLFAMAVAIAAITLLAQRAAVRELEAVPLTDRLSNAALSVWQYVGQAVWPVDLAVFYPFPRDFASWQVAVAAVALVVVTAGVWRRVDRWPAVAVGWTWYLVTLLPVVGLITVGNQARADRYTYLPHIGLALAVVWLAARWLVRVPRPWATAAAAVPIAGYALVTWTQIDVWRDSRSLFEHALAVTDDNHVAHLNLGVVDLEAGDLEAARAHFEAVLRIQPAHPLAENNLGLVGLHTGRLDEAVTHLQRAVQLDPGYADAWDNLGQALERQGDAARAETSYRRALNLQPDHRVALLHLGTSLGRTGRYDEAVPLLSRALELDPASADGWINLGNVQFARGDLDAAQQAYARALELAGGPQARYSLGLIEARRGHEARGLDLMRQAADQPDASASILASVAWRLATHPASEMRDGPAALDYAQRAVEQSEGRDARSLAALAAACAELGRFGDAVGFQQRALGQAPPVARDELQRALQAYQEGRPFRAR